MKKYRLILTFCLVSSCFTACEEEGNGDPGPWENSGPLAEYTVTPINGGATISYVIPDDPGLQYIMAEFERNGATYTEKSSIYKNSLTIDGFNTTDPVQATLYKVNKQGQKSSPLKVEFTPLESLLSITKKSLKFQTGFGGIIASWENPHCTEFGFRLMVEDEETGKGLKTVEMYYSDVAKEKHSFRGYEAKETTFAISIEDKWGNVSDTMLFKTTPFFESIVEKPYADYRAWIPYDNTTNLSTTYTFTKLWDNIVNTNRNGWLTKSGSSGRSMTIDLKQKVKLSRIVTHGYHVNSITEQANITGYELWGTDKIDNALLSDKAYWLDETSVREGAIQGVDPATVLPERTFKDDWTFLGRCYYPDYKNDANAYNSLSANGVELELSDDARPVRYIRMIVRQVTLNDVPASNYFSMGEITLYGDTTVPQD